MTDDHPATAAGERSTGNRPMPRDIPIKVVGKVGLILDAFRRLGAELTLGQIAAAAQLETSTASRLVASLVQTGLLRHDPLHRLYAPGLIMLELSRAVLNRFSFRELAHRELSALSASTGWQCYLAVADEDDAHQVIYIDAVSTKVPELSEVGQRRPMHSTSTGKILLAFREGDLGDWPLERSTPNTKTHRQVLLRELQQTRRNGYATAEDEEELDTCTVAAPIFDGNGHVVAALGVATTDRDFRDNRNSIIDTVVAKARGITSALRLSEQKPQP
jgi:DNA-binding IclR family transcriptional regulator